MYDVSRGDNATGFVAGGIAFFVFASFSVGFMMWWGFGGYAAIAPAGLQSLAAQIPIYLCVELVVVHGLLFWSSKNTRNGALYGYLSPWAILALIAIPQFLHAPNEVLLILVMPVLVYVVHGFVEGNFHCADDA